MYQYDANGNMVSGAGRTITYNYDNMPTSIVKGGATTTSVYDANGQRVRKVVAGITTIYIGKYCEYTNGTCKNYIFGGADRIASIEGSTTRYYHTDHLGSASVITGGQGGIVQSIYYYPYGEIHTNSGTDVTRYKFTGQEYDAETGLYYYNVRYYDPKLARFIAADTIVPDFTDPQTLNRYSYCVNNPINLIDPTGHWFGISAIVGALIGGISAAIQGGDFGDILKGMAIGAFSGAVGYGFGSWAGGLVPASQVTASAVVAGAAGGMAAGATSSALYGGNIGQGALIGFVAGGIGGYIGTINFHDVYLEGLAQVSTGALVGGAASELTGGKFGEGFKLGVISGNIAFATNRILEAKLNKDKLDRQTNEALKIVPEKIVKEVADTPLKGVPLKGVDFQKFRDVFKPLGNEIDRIRQTGLGKVENLRFNKFHIKNYDGTPWIHYDPYNPVTHPTPHFIFDVLPTIFR